MPSLADIGKTGTYVSNGQRSLLRDFAPKTNPQTSIDSWFQGSKITDEEGNPQIMYHGTLSNFDEFKPANYRKAIFFSPSKEFAKQSAGGEWAPYSKVTPIVKQVHINAKNPFDFENKQHLAQLEEYLHPSIWDDENEKIAKGNWKSIEDESVQDAIKRAGFDSFYVKERGVKNLGIYDPNQVRVIG